MENVKAFIERGNDGSYSVYVDLEDNSLNYGIHGNGTTADEAIADFNSSYRTMKTLYDMKGKSFVEAKFSFTYDTASFLSYYSRIFSLAGLQKITGVNQGQLSHYLNGHRKPSRKTVVKIEESLQKFAKEVIDIHLL